MIAFLRQFAHEGARHSGEQPGRLAARPSTSGGLGSETSHDHLVRLLGTLTTSFARHITEHWPTVRHDAVLFDLARALGDLVDGLAGGDDVTEVVARLHRLEAQLPRPNDPDLREDL